MPKFKEINSFNKSKAFSTNSDFLNEEDDMIGFELQLAGKYQTGVHYGSLDSVEDSNRFEIGLYFLFLLLC